MISRIIKHEWRVLVTDKLLWILLPVYALLIGYGVYNGAAWVRFQEQTLVAAKAQADTTISGLRTTTASIERGGAAPPPYEDPRDAGIVSRGLGYEFATLPPSAMAPLAIGQSDLMPYYYRITRRALDEYLNDEIENPLNLAGGRFDLGFVITYLYPLLILALTYNLLSVEREQGTQSLLLSQPVSVRQWVTGKIILRGLVVFGSAVVLSLAAFVLSGVSLASGDSLTRLLMWIVVLAGYGAFWFGLAILVNALGFKSSTNALALMASWLLFVLLVPSLLNVMAKTIYPTPSRIALVQALRTADAQNSQEDSQMLTGSRESEGSMPAYGGNESEDTKVALTEFYRDMLRAERRSESARSEIMAHFDRQIDSQQAFVRRFRFASPVIVTQSAIAELAGTGASRFEHFNAAVRTFHQSWRAFFDPKIMKDNRVTAAEYESLPRFHYTEEPLSAVIRRGFGDLLPLLVLAAASMFLGFHWLRRYRVVG